MKDYFIDFRKTKLKDHIVYKEFPTHIEFEEKGTITSEYFKKLVKEIVFEKTGKHIKRIKKGRFIQLYISTENAFFIYEEGDFTFEVYKSKNITDMDLLTYIRKVFIRNFLSNAPDTEPELNKTLEIYKKTISLSSRTVFRLINKTIIKNPWKYKLTEEEIHTVLLSRRIYFTRKLIRKYTQHYDITPVTYNTRFVRYLGKWFLNAQGIPEKPKEELIRKFLILDNSIRKQKKSDKEVYEKAYGGKYGEHILCKFL